MAWFGDMHLPTFLITSLFWGGIFIFLWWWARGHSQFLVDQIAKHAEVREEMLDRFMTMSNTLAQYREHRPLAPATEDTPDEVENAKPPPLTEEERRIQEDEDSLHAWMSTMRPGVFVGS